MIGFVGVEGDARAVVRPCGTPGFKVALGNLHGRSPERRHDVEMGPTIFAAEEPDPFPIARRSGLSTGLAAVGTAPELVLLNFVALAPAAVVGRTNRSDA